MLQTEMILKHLEEFGTITPLEALEEYGCMRLSARIADLRDSGVKITSTRETKRNRFGKKVSFARYKLEV